MNSEFFVGQIVRVLFFRGHPKARILLVGDGFVTVQDWLRAQRDMVLDEDISSVRLSFKWLEPLSPLEQLAFADG